MRGKRIAQAGLGVAAAAALAALPLAHPAEAATSTVTVSVNAAAQLAQIPITAFGVNTAVWDGDLMNPDIPSLLRQLDVGMLRYPGGSTADIYDWETNSIVPGQSSYAFPQNNFANFMKLVQEIGGQPIITVNYGTNFAGTGGGEPSEAAAWVQYAVDHHYNAQYWEIGNEVYGNGTYGTPGWETDLHSQLGPQAYANNVLQYIQAMRAVDPHIKIGVVLTLPYNWPWGVNPNWNQAVLQTDGPYINFVVVHWYPQNPGQESDSGLLADTNQVPAMLSTLKQEINAWAGSNAPNIQIFLDETNSVSSDPGKQTLSVVNALFLDNDFMSWLRGGVANVSWWDLHNGATAGNASPSLYGTAQYGDYGLLSNGSSVNGITEPPVDTPFPSYYGYEMLTKLAQPGDTIVDASTNQGLVDAYAVRQRNGSLAVMVVNTDPNNAYTVNLNLMGFRGMPLMAAGRGRAALSGPPSAAPITEYSYGPNQTGISETMVPPGQPLTVAPYSVDTFVLHGHVAVPFRSPRFSASTQLSSSSVIPGQTETISTTFADNRGTLHDGTLDVEVYNSSGQQVGQDLVPNVSLHPGQSQTVQYAWTAPNAADTYTVKAFVFNQDLAQADLADQNAATFNVEVPPAPNAFTATAKLSASTVPAGSTVTITATYTNTSTNGGYLESGILDMEEHDASNNKVAQDYWTVTLAPGQSVTETYDFTVPATAATGATYTVQLGVFSAGWSTNYYYNSDAATITVGG